MHTPELTISLLLALGSIGLAATDASASAIHVPRDPQLYPPVVLPPLAGRQDVDNTCGIQRGKAFKCNPASPGGGPCCSSYGFCGNGPLYCGSGCQPKYGQCETSHETQTHVVCGPKHKSKSCSPGYCCSANGKCGKSEAFCGKHCQPKFGKCHSTQPTQPSQPPQPPSTPRPSPPTHEGPERCGKDFNGISCTNDECCSDSGYCGKGKDYCSVPQNCQREFGTCDSDAVPHGLDISTQPRPQVGKVPYGHIIQHCVQPKYAALSFDDGPSNNTNEILDILQQHGAKATFFLSGNTNGKGMIDETDKWVDVVKRMITEGHQIGSHTWSHPKLDVIPRDARLTDMYRNERAISNIIGKFPAYMRPPYAVCPEACGCLKDMTELGYHVVSYEVDTRDTESGVNLDQMKAMVNKSMTTKGANDNIFIIQHDHTKHAPELTRYILELVKTKGWSAMTLGECLDDPAHNWYRDAAWLEYKAMSPNGCFSSGPGFCGQVFSFDNKGGCYFSRDKCTEKVKKCAKRLGKNDATCVDYERICGKLKNFCDNCDNKGQPDCKSENWYFDRI